MATIDTALAQGIQQFLTNLTNNTAYTPAVNGFGTLAANNLYFRLVGDKYHISGRFTAGTPTAVAAQIPIPFGDKAFAGAGASNGWAVGKWVRNNGSANSNKQGVILAYPNDSNLYFAADDYTNTSNPLVALNGTNVALAGETISLVGEIIVPSTLFQGYGALTTATASQEYAYNSSTSLTGDTTSFASGSAGALIRAYTTTQNLNAVVYRVQFQNVILPTDLIIIEISNDNGTTWMAHNQLEFSYTRNDAGTIAYGIAWSGVSSTQLDVRFYYQSTPGIAWSVYTGVRWRVRKVTPTAPVGVLPVTSSTPGLAPPQSPQTSLTVTGTGWTTRRAVGIYYQDQLGIHRMKFNIVGDVTSATRSAFSATIAGTVFKATTAQAVSTVLDAGSNVSSNGYAAQNSGLLSCNHGSATTTAYYWSGDVELESKPTWA